MATGLISGGLAIRADSNADALGRSLSNIVARQLPFATAMALTETAKSVREAEVAEMGRVFDRPTRFTLNAFQVVPARKDTLVAEVRYKDVIPYAGRHFLETQVEGGSRRLAAWERQLVSSGAMMGLGLSPEAIIPARAAKRDAFGNWSTGERNRVLSALQAQRDTLSNTTDRSRSRNSRRAEYYIGKRGRVTGVFRRRGDEDDLILLFVNRRPVYQPRFDFFGVARRTWSEVYEAKFSAAMERALAHGHYQTVRGGQWDVGSARPVEPGSWRS